MVKKKRAKKKRRVVRRATSKSVRLVRSSQRKINLVLKNLILFVILAILSVVLYSASGNELYSSLFLLLSILFGFVAVAFLIILLIFVFMRTMKK